MDYLVAFAGGSWWVVGTLRPVAVRAGLYVTQSNGRVCTHMSLHSECTRVSVHGLLALILCTTDSSCLINTHNMYVITVDISPHTHLYNVVQGTHTPHCAHTN